MSRKITIRLLAMSCALAACGGASDTVSYTARVTGIDVTQKGSSQQLAVDGLPSESATLIQPRRRRQSDTTN
jgi:hypothetical protein